MVLAFRQHLFVRSEKLCKVTQTSAECKTKNEVFGFAYAECSQTYVKLSKRVQNTKRNRRFQYRAVVSVAQVT